MRLYPGAWYGWAVMVVMAVLATTSSVSADIFEWEFVDPGDPSLGMQQSSLAVPDGVGVNAEPGALLGNLDLTMAYLIGSDLSGADMAGSTLVFAALDGADLTNASIVGADLRSVRGLTQSQLASTASYQAGDLSGVSLVRDEMTGWDFAGQTMFRANLSESNLTNAKFVGADLTQAHMLNVTLADADLSGADLMFADVTNGRAAGADFVGANLTFSKFFGATLTGADLTDADITGADFGQTTLFGFTYQQLASTASFKAGGLSVRLIGNDMTGWDFSGLTVQGDLSFSTLIDADFAGASLRGLRMVLVEFGGVDFRTTDLFGANMTSSNMEGAMFAGVNLSQVDLTSAVLAGADLTDTTFNTASRLTGADLTGADTRNSSVSATQINSIASTRNMIRPDGTVLGGLTLVASEVMRISDSTTLPITIHDAMSLETDGRLRMVFSDLDWGSLIRFDTSVGTAFLGGVLELDLILDAGLTVQDLLGSTFQLFDWNGVTIDGAFDQIVIDPAFTSAGLGFDTTALYSTGEVTVIPEPAAGVLLGVGGVCLLRRR